MTDIITIEDKIDSNKIPRIRNNDYHITCALVEKLLNRIKEHFIDRDFKDIYQCYIEKSLAYISLKVVHKDIRTVLTISAEYTEVFRPDQLKVDVSRDGYLQCDFMFNKLLMYSTVSYIHAGELNYGTPDNVPFCLSRMYSILFAYLQSINE